MSLASLAWTIASCGGVLVTDAKPPGLRDWAESLARIAPASLTSTATVAWYVTGLTFVSEIGSPLWLSYSTFVVERRYGLERVVWRLG